MEQILQAIKELKDRMNSVELKLSQYIDNVHGTSTDGIAESQGTIVDLEIEVAMLESRVEELEEKIDPTTDEEEPDPVEEEEE